MKTYILYHKNCTDGFGAAYAAWKKLHDVPSYIAVAYDEPTPQIDSNSLVYVVDYCLSISVTKELQGRGCKVITLDHHISSEENIKASNEFVFDITRSGAKIAWEYFHPKTANQMIEYISDKDLGNFSLPKVKEIISALESYGRDFKTWDNLDINQLILDGNSILRSKNNEVDILVGKAYFYKLGQYKVPVVNTPVYMSEVADKLLDVYPDSKFSGTYCIYEKNGTLYRKWSLRSKKVDVNSIAQKFGGGGHAYAAAFIESLDQSIKGSKDE